MITRLRLKRALFHRLHLVTFIRVRYIHAVAFSCYHLMMHRYRLL